MNDFVIDKPGRYKTRGGSLAIVLWCAESSSQLDIFGYIPDEGVIRYDSFNRIGVLHSIYGLQCLHYDSDNDLTEYLGPLQPGDDEFNTNE